MVYNNLGQRFLEMGQKPQIKLFFGQIGRLAQKYLILMFLAHVRKSLTQIVIYHNNQWFFLNIFL